ncbi:hypothetical protein ACO2Q0_17265 [Phenylobacterium sp. VNQ135]|uniref:hypothetical protein n=1 Tax=Phenylobacterium sp. VNQ135 TaxID=3400922 RepID=UPI003BFFB74F
MADFIKMNVRGVTLHSAVGDTLENNFDRHFRVHYNVQRDSYLTSLCETYGTDKGSFSMKGRPFKWPPHTYADFYERFFGHCREYVRNVFECGLGTNNPELISSMGVAGKPGASLRMWRDYFPNAEIVGADIDGDILFTEERIRTFQCDQTDPEAIARLWEQVGDVKFDLMIDDGLHTAKAAVTLLRNSLQRLKPGGFYIIEDVAFDMMVDLLGYLKKTSLNYEIVTLHRPPERLRDNSMVVIRA